MLKYGKLCVKIKKMKSWILIGPSRHWKIGLKESPPVWGLTQRYYTTYIQMGKGDLLFFYVTSPVSGITGYGYLEEKFEASFHKDRLIWPAEKDKGIPIWKLRFNFSAWIIPVEYWKRDNLKVSLPFYQTSILPVSEEIAVLWKSKLDSKNLIRIGKTYKVEEERKVKEIVKEGKEVISLHEELKQKIFDIGQIQNYYPETEFPLVSGGKVDVVWKYTKEGVPSFVFEIELSNNFGNALSRLEIAFRSWNASLRLIGRKEKREKIETMVKYKERNFRNAFIFIEVEKLTDFYKKKYEFKKMEKELGF